jgi:DNA-binding MarR family transcriptional regulator
MNHPNIKSVGWVLIHTARLHRFHLSEQLADKGLYPGQEQVMRALATAEQLSVGELAQILQVRAPTVSKSINCLSALGLVERLPSSDSDRRSVSVKLTPQGRALAASIEASWNKVEDASCGTLMRRKGAVCASCFGERAKIWLRLSEATSGFSTYQTMP